MAKSKTAEDYCREADNLLNNNQYSEAVAAYETALRIKPDYEKALTGKASALFCGQRYEEALRFFDSIESRIRNTEFLHYMRPGKAFILHRILHRPEEALNYVNRMLGIDPNHVDILIQKCNILNSLKRYDEALATGEKLRKIYPLPGEAYLAIGHTFYHLERYQEALSAYDDAVYREPNNATGHYQRGSALFMLKRYAEALTAYDKALQLDPNDSVIREQRERVLARLKK